MFVSPSWCQKSEKIPCGRGCKLKAAFIAASSRFHSSLQTLRPKKKFSYTKPDTKCWDVNPRTPNGLFKNARSTECKFPFTYKSKTYHGCTDFDHYRAWCSIDTTFKNRYKNCPIGSDGCKFPFIYNNKKYYNCIRTKDESEPWCSPSYRYKGRRKTCYASVTQCKFPFQYNGRSHQTCTTLSSEDEPWCSVDKVFNNRWRKCPIGGEGCVFPFSYKGIIYKTCTRKDHYTLWCSKDKIFKNNWKNCLSGILFWVFMKKACILRTMF
ncbi:epididymal sperm-binding protein 1-like [Hydractinia symbiolongicarpus]|uniref:epididymal sperm-binding protein 1-like n=1 Tax=Hydractinia symbiolongicarpus TaxID=13093 RepID=UPI00254FF8E8|nr:epididymal sperm-binding protein 1-like [Hydractinia symbiolongicarpus]